LRSLKAMLRHLITRLQQAERFGGGLTYLFNDWTERFGPVKDCEVHIRQKTIKK
jgi:hypothetical protein